MGLVLGSEERADKESRRTGFRSTSTEKEQEK